MTKFASISIIWLLVSALVQYTAARTVPLQTTRNIEKEQWKLYLLQVNFYRGLWARVNMNGESLSSTTYTTNFTELPNQPAGSEKVQLTVTYDDASFSRFGASVIRFMYLNGKPPKFGVRLSPNGTLSSDVAEGTIFYPQSFAVRPSQDLAESSPIFAIDKNLVSPLNNRHRINILPVYLGNALSYVSFAREGAETDQYPIRTPFSTEEQGTRLASGRMTHGAYTGVKQCVRPDYTYTRTVVGYTNGLPALLTGSARVALQLPDGIAVSYPRKVGPSTVGSRLTFDAEWVLSANVVLRSWTVYSADGKFFKDCTATFHKVG